MMSDFGSSRVRVCVPKLLFQILFLPVSAGSDALVWHKSDTAAHARNPARRRSRSRFDTKHARILRTSKPHAKTMPLPHTLALWLPTETPGSALRGVRGGLGLMAGRESLAV